MKNTFLMTMLLVSSVFAQAASSCDNVTRIGGAAALELYASLNLPETLFQDENGGPEVATGKHGKLVGCQKTLKSGTIECWIVQPFTGNNCDQGPGDYSAPRIKAGKKRPIEAFNRIRL